MLKQSLDYNNGWAGICPAFMKGSNMKESEKLQKENDELLKQINQQLRDIKDAIAYLVNVMAGKEND